MRMRATALVYGGIALSFVIGVMPAVSMAQPLGEEAEAHRETLSPYGCLGCHSTDGSPRVGPTFSGLAGSTRVGERDGERVEEVADEAYLEEALIAPDAIVADGFAPRTMPAFALSPEELEAVIAAVQYAAAHPLEEPEPESPLWHLIIAALLFVGGHLLLSSHPLRRAIITKISERGFVWTYSLLAGGALAWMSWAWETAPFVELWPSPAWTRHVPLAIMPIALFFLIAGYTTKNPASAGQESQLEEAEVARGVVKITRHPALWGFLLWGLCHLPPNGDLASVIFFLAFAALAFLGMLHIDRRRARQLGAEWDKMLAQTSIIPFVALIQGRTRVTLREIGWWRIIVSIAAYFLTLYFAHEWMMGVSALPF